MIKNNQLLRDVVCKQTAESHTIDLQSFSAARIMSLFLAHHLSHQNFKMIHMEYPVRYYYYFFVKIK